MFYLDAFLEIKSALCFVRRGLEKGQWWCGDRNYVQEEIN